MNDTALFNDWCAATSRTSPTPTDLRAFVADVMGSKATTARRVTAIERLLGWRQKTEPVARSWNTDDGLLPLCEALSRCAAYDWPDGFRGRRDAWLLILLSPVADGGLGLTRRQAASLESSDIRLDLFAENDDPQRCPKCVAVRWLHVVGLEHQWSRSAVRSHLATTTVTRHTHAADHWQSAWTLAPAIDRHGWATDWRPMTTRAITTVLARRRDGAAPLVSAPMRKPATTPLRIRDEDIELTLDRLDVVAASADQVNTRVAALLDDTDAMLRALIR